MEDTKGRNHLLGLEDLAVAPETLGVPGGSGGELDHLLLSCWSQVAELSRVTSLAVDQLVAPLKVGGGVQGSSAGGAEKALPVVGVLLGHHLLSLVHVPLASRANWSQASTLPHLAVIKIFVPTSCGEVVLIAALARHLPLVRAQHRGEAEGSVAEATGETGFVEKAATSCNSFHLENLSTTSWATVLVLDSCGGLARCWGVLQVGIAVATVDLLVVADKHLQLVSLGPVALLAGETALVEVAALLHHLLLLEHGPATPGAALAVHRQDGGGVRPQERLLSLAKAFSETFPAVDLAVGGLKGIDKSRVQLPLALVAGKALLVEEAGLGGDLLGFKNLSPTSATTITDSRRGLDESGVRNFEATVRELLLVATLTVCSTILSNDHCRESEFP